jgi:23S rRNA pseudouridine2605 synthase
LERVLSRAGVASRREAETLIRAGRVRVNGKLTTDPGAWLDPERDRVDVNGNPLRAAERVYLLLYKPTGYLTTRRDPEGRPTVFDLLADAGTHLTYAGRLDEDTSGLLILTNDNDFAEHLTNPASHVAKTYLVKAGHLLSDQQLEQLRNGVELSDGPTLPASVRRVRDTASRTFLELTITEGRNRQVRRMLEAIGSHVAKLVRTRIGPVGIGDLPIGRWRELTRGELKQLRSAK